MAVGIKRQHMRSRKILDLPQRAARGDVIRIHKRHVPMQTRDQNILSDQPIAQSIVVSGGLHLGAKLRQGHIMGSLLHIPI